MSLYGYRVLKMEQDGSIKYDRYAFSREGWDYTQTTTGEEINVPYFGEYFFTEAMPSIEINSIKKYGGFYIGRYEVGIVGYDEEVKTSNTNKETEWTGYSNGKVVVQKDRQVWNYITRDKAKKVAEGMYANNKAVISRLCSSYAWDTTLKFIETNHVGYATNREGGNYSGALKNTGIGSTPRNNIYDMGGNVWNLTTEIFSNLDNPYALRGGNYVTTVGEYPSGSRNSIIQSYAVDNVGFRSTLYVGL